MPRYSGMKSALYVLTLAILLTVSFGACAGNNPAASGAQIAFVGAWDRTAPLLERSSREVNVAMDFFPSIDAFMRSLDGGLPRHRLIYVLNLAPAEVPALVQILTEARQAKIPFTTVALDERDTQLPLDKAGLLTHDPVVQRYWKYNGLINVKRLLQYSARTWLARDMEVLPPVIVPDFGIYHPRGVDIFADAASYRSWYRENGSYTPAGPWVVMLIHGSFWVTGDTQDLDALIESYERQGINVATVFGDTIKRIRQLTEPFNPELLLLEVHVSINEGGESGAESLRSLGAPFLKPISLLGATVEEWLDDPRGLTPQDVGLHLTVMESQGIIEPILIGGLEARVSGFRVHKPIPDRIERFVQRSVAWINLRHKAPEEKKVAIVYFNKYLGKSDLMRGSPTGAYLDGPRSLVALLRRLDEAGYDVTRLPQQEQELIGWIMEGGRNIGPWAKGELIDMVENSNPVLIPLATYKQWFRTIPEVLQEEVIRNFGPPPGNLMVYEENGRPFIVIPRIELGNLILLPQPVRGDTQDEKLLHSRDQPPPHNYIAFYFWLQKEFRADAIIHFGTHGSLELLPTKAAGLSKNDWGDILIGNIPNIQPWILDNLGEATLAKRRAYAVLVDHLVPPIVGAGLAAGYKDLHDEIDKFDTLEEGLLREQFRKSIAQRAADLHLFTDIGISQPASLTDGDVRKIAIYLHEIYNDTTPVKLHVLGETPAPQDLVPYITSILGTKFLEALATGIDVPPGEDHFGGDRRKYLRGKAEQVLSDILVEGKDNGEALARAGGNRTAAPALREKMDFARELYRRFSMTGNEIENIVLALDGQYIQPGPGNDPVRNPGAIPTGRNMYAVNPEEIPVRPAWETAKILVDKLLSRKLEEDGHYPKKIGIDLNGHDTMRHYGVTEGQILYLMGVRPVWNENNLVIDVELIPKALLKRPRIDVFMAMGGAYRDNFPSRVELLDKAVRLVSSIDEQDNYVRDFSLTIEKQLLARNFSAQMASNLSRARIFGAKPGEFGTRILHLIPRSGVWDDVQEVTDVYKDTMSYVFTAGKWGKKVDGLYEVAMTGTSTVLRTWASNMTSPLTNHHFYEYLGGLSLAVEDVTGTRPTAYVADVRDPDRARIETFEKILQQEFRVRLFNKKWIEGMMSNDYAGAGQMAELVKNTFGWEVTRPESVRNDTWKEIMNIYVTDSYDLAIDRWFATSNPHAIQEIAATLLEAARKNYWAASDEDLQKLTRTFMTSVADHGLSAGLITGGNTKLNDYVRQIYTAPGSVPDSKLLEQFEAQLRYTDGPRMSERVRGNKLAEESSEQDETSAETVPESSIPLENIIIGLVVLFLILAGYRLRRGFTRYQNPAGAKRKHWKP